jgi:hypothetical protein
LGSRIGVLCEVLAAVNVGEEREAEFKLTGVCFGRMGVVGLLAKRGFRDSV